MTAVVYAVGRPPRGGDPACPPDAELDMVRVGHSPMLVCWQDRQGRLWDRDGRPVEIVTDRAVRG